MLVALVRDLLGRRHECLDLAEVEDRVAVILLLDDAGDDVALASGVLTEGDVALGLPQSLEDDLLGGLRGDPAEVLGGVLPFLQHGDLFGLFVDLDVLSENLDVAGLSLDDSAGSAGLVGISHAEVCGRECLLDRFDDRFKGDPTLTLELPQ